MHNLSPRPNGTMTVCFGALSGTVTGGPYSHVIANPDRYDLRVKLAREISADCEVDLPIRDFSTPDPAAAEKALEAVIDALAEGKSVFVGCMGGFGRTGLFLALLAKVQSAYEHKYGTTGSWDYDDPVAVVREQYCRHAVETAGQEDFVHKFNVSGLVERAHALQPAPAHRGFFARILAAIGDILRTLRGLPTARPGA